MASDTQAGNQWERVTAELRACREAQQRAWGDIDNTLLGRYLAGEVNAEERRRIESALDELPQLRTLTDLVRDVLGECEPAAGEPAVPQNVPPGPAILPFSQPQVRSWKRPTRASRYRQLAGLVAAAVLLLALGISLPQAGKVPPPAGSAVALSPAMALRGEEPFQLTLAGIQAANADNRLFRAATDRELVQRMEHVDELGARIHAEVETLEKQGKKREAERLARQYASNLTRLALFDRQNGELDRAELAYNEASALCTRALGPDAPETIRTRNSLAGVYEVALNMADSSAYSLGSAGAATPSFAFSEISSSKKEGDAKNGAYFMAHPAPPDAAPPRALSPQVRTSSGYGPPVKALPQQRVESHGQRVHVYHSTLPSAQIRQQAAVVLRDRIISQRPTELKNSVVPVLTQALREAKNPTERQRFALALGHLGPAARDSVEGLLDCYHRATAASERATILLSLGEIGPSAPQALPVLVDSLRSDSPEVRNSAARALVSFGPAARPSVRKLALERPTDPLLRDVLVRIDSPEGRCGIYDESGCFSIKTVQQTQREIHQLATAFRLEIRVETSHNPVQLVAKKSEDRPPTREIWLYEQAKAPSPVALKMEGKKRTRQIGEYGVYVHINKDAPDVQVYVSDALQARGLTDTQLRQVVEPHLRNKEFDRGLREGVLFLARFEQEHASGK